MTNECFVDRWLGVEIEVEAEEARRFACNAVVVGQAVGTHHRQSRSLRRPGLGEHQRAQRSNQPQRLGSFKHPTCSESVSFADGIAYLAHGDIGLEIIDLSDPHEPVVRQNVPTAGHVRGVVARNDRAFVANGYTGLRVLDEVANGRDPGIGKSVAVIGGGNAAMDAARVSRRLGAEVTILYRRRIEDMPADPEEIHEAQAEGVRIVIQAIPVEVTDAEQPGRVAIKWGEAEMVPDPKGGRPRPVLQEDRMHLDSFDTIISAIGQGSDLDFISKQDQEQLEVKWGKFIAGDYQATRMQKLFVGGDVANRTADAISAIEDGHHAARGIDRFLTGSAGSGAA